jgi:ribosomal protein S18 acetylase RimI-like enzyme
MSSDLHLLDNIMWHALTGAHARFALGAGGARRFAPGFSPILGFAEPQQPDFAALEPFCAPGEQFYTDGWNGAPPPGWTIERESTMFKMVWDAPAPAREDGLDAAPLRAEQAQEALALAELTRPGPFGPRTPELGEYFAYAIDGRLAAMAGERMAAPGLREISGVCTHPDFQGRGFAGRLMRKLIFRELARGERPFLHVMRDNVGARGLYERMGFVNYAESVVRVVAWRA